MVPLGVELAIAVIVVLLLLFHGAALWLARQMPALEPEARPPPEGPRPKVSVVIAARDEEEDLATALDSLLQQDYPQLEVVVVEGGSRDRTREVVQRRAPAVRLVDEPPLPAGWVGKNWACWNGTRASSGEWLLFLDADVRLHPAAVRTVMDWSASEGAALATIAPRILMGTFWERTVLPFYVQMVLTYFRAPHVNRDDSKAAMANGQCWLVSRADYDALGGHEAVRDLVLEDVGIARRFRGAGKRIRLAWAPELATTRMYRDRHEMFEGIVKNVHGTDFAASRQVGFLAALVGLFWLPLGLLPWGLLSGSSGLTILGALVALALFGKHVLLARAVGAPARYGLLYPVAVGFYVAVLLRSIRVGARGGRVSWKGRSYPVSPKG